MVSLRNRRRSRAAAASRVEGGPPEAALASRRDSFTFDGADVPFVPGQSIAAALVQEGRRTTRLTRFADKPRGLFCGIGVCFDCLVTVDGRPNVRACTEPARAGAAVQTQRGVGERPFDLVQQDLGGEHRGSGPPPAAVRLIEAEVVVVGAGPAGLAAAVAAADSGAEVTVVDAGHAPGGQYLRRPATSDPRGDGSRRVGRRGGPAQVALARATSHPRVRFLPGHTVWTIGLAGDRPILNLVESDTGTEVELQARAVVLAPGAYDRVVPFPGWDLPGVMTAGAAQALLKEHGVLAGRRLLLAGTGPFLLAVAAGLAEAGANVAAVVEANRPQRWLRHPLIVGRSAGRLREAIAYQRVLRRHRVPMLSGHAVTAVDADRHGLRSIIERVDEQWRVVPGGRRLVHANAVCVGFGFTPSVELAINLGCPLEVDQRDGNVVVSVDRMQRTGVRNVVAAGEVTGIAGARRAAWQGTIAGLAAAAAAGRLSEIVCARAVASMRRHLAIEERFADAMHGIYPLQSGWRSRLTPDTLVCRCEEVTAGRLDAGRSSYGGDDLRSLRLLTRLGMGPCQGRICGYPAAALIDSATGRQPDMMPILSRPIVTPVALATLATPTGTASDPRSA